MRNPAALESEGRFFAHDDNGAGLVEYALLVALIALLLIGAMLFLSGSLEGFFSDAGTTIDNL